MSATASESRAGRAVATGAEAGGDRDPATLDPPEPAEAGAPAPEIVAATVAAVVAGVVLRFTARSALWLDEALSVNIAELPLGEIPGALRQDGHPPLYYVLLHGWISAFGDGDTAVRALSGVFALLALPLAYLAGRRIGGRTLGLIATGVFAATPFLIRYATETRMYALVGLLVLAGYLLVDDVARRGRDGLGRLAALALTVAALLWTHYWGMWIAGALGLVLLWAGWRAHDPAVRRGSLRALGAVVVGGVLFLPWVPTLLYQSAHTGTPWAGPVRPTAFASLTMTDLAGVGFSDAALIGAVVLVLVLLGVFGRALDARHIELDLRVVRRLRPEVAVLGLTVALGILVMYGTWSAYATRYASVFVPLVLVLAAAGITRFAGRWVRAGVYVATLALLGLGGVYSSFIYQRTQLGDLAPILAERTRPGDVVVTCPDQLGPATLRVVPDGVEVVGYPTLSTPDRIDWVDYADRLDVDVHDYATRLVDLAGPEGTVALVWSTTYLTHEGRCEALFGALADLRPAETPMSQDGSRYFESATLSLFPPAP